MDEAPLGENWRNERIALSGTTGDATAADDSSGQPMLLLFNGSLWAGLVGQWDGTVSPTINLSASFTAA